MVLTGEGKRRLSRGELDFCYWIPFDVELDYSPYIAESASLTPVQLSASVDLHIETTPIREATTGYRSLNPSGSDETNVRNPMFSVPTGHRVVPRMTASDGPTGSLVVGGSQRALAEILVRKSSEGDVTQIIGPFDRGFERFDPTSTEVGHTYSRDGFPKDQHLEGVLIRVYRSGSDGLTEVDPRRDMAGRISFGNDFYVRIVTPEDDDGTL